MLERLSTSEKVLEALKERGTSKVWLAEKMEISYPTLYSRLDNNDWTLAETLLLQKLLNIN
jgi:lambda repressor-like predicted transcriptional regulator